MGREIVPWFESAAVVEDTATRFIVELKLTPKYRASLGRDGREVHLGFHFLKGASVLGTGEVPVQMRAEEASMKITLPNLERVAAKEIEIYLAH
jgi:hypothetical protein